MLQSWRWALRTRCRNRAGSASPPPRTVNESQSYEPGRSTRVITVPTIPPRFASLDGYNQTEYSQGRAVPRLHLSDHMQHPSENLR